VPTGQEPDVTCFGSPGGWNCGVEIHEKAIAKAQTLIEALGTFSASPTGSSW